MKKVIARYFYSPICTESFASLDRQRRLFNTMKEHVHFEAFNTIEDHFDSVFPWFTNEKELLATLEGTGNRPLTYSKLFIEGNEIKGFPPSKKMIGQILQAYDINFQQEAYQTYYKQTNLDSWDISVDKLKVRKYEKKLLKDVCLVCTKYNPFLEIEDYMKEKWNEYEALKESYLEEKLQEEKMIGFIAYYEEQPVGIIEAFPLKLAAKLGFPISDVNLNGIMITCLNIRKEVSGNGIASKLVKEISNEAGNSNYQSIEVLAFPDKSNWQPISLYQAQGYTLVKALEDLSLMRKDLTQL